MAGLDMHRPGVLFCTRSHPPSRACPTFDAVYKSYLGLSIYKHLSLYSGYNPSRFTFR